MTGIPDAVVEVVAEALDRHAWFVFRPNAEYPGWDRARQEDYRAEARAALEAAEGPWREHLAAQTCCPCSRHSHQCTSYCQEHQ